MGLLLKSWLCMFFIYIQIYNIISIPTLKLSENGRVTNQLNLGKTECCPCPKNADADNDGKEVDLEDVAESRTVDVGAIPAGTCPCLPSGTDSIPSASVNGPNGMRNANTMLRDHTLKEESKPLLHPEVGFASSVLETLREATEDEYQDALERDAARSAIKGKKTDSSDILKSPTRNIVTIILNPPTGLEMDDDIGAEETKTQETRCIIPTLGAKSSATSEDDIEKSNKLKDIFEPLRLKFLKSKHDNVLNQDNGFAASNLDGVRKKLVNIPNLKLERKPMHQLFPQNFKVPRFNLKPITSMTDIKDYAQKFNRKSIPITLENKLLPSDFSSSNLRDSDYSPSNINENVEYMLPLTNNALGLKNINNSIPTSKVKEIIDFSRYSKFKSDILDTLSKATKNTHDKITKESDQILEEPLQNVRNTQNKVKSVSNENHCINEDEMSNVESASSKSNMNLEDSIQSSSNIKPIFSNNDNSNQEIGSINKNGLESMETFIPNENISDIKDASQTFNVEDTESKTSNTDLPSEVGSDLFNNDSSDSSVSDVNKSQEFTENDQMTQSSSETNNDLVPDEPVDIKQSQEDDVSTPLVADTPVNRNDIVISSEELDNERNINIDYDNETPNSQINSVSGNSDIIPVSAIFNPSSTLLSDTADGNFSLDTGDSADDIISKEQVVKAITMQDLQEMSNSLLESSLKNDDNQSDMDKSLDKEAMVSSETKLSEREKVTDGIESNNVCITPKNSEHKNEETVDMSGEASEAIGKSTVYYKPSQDYKFKSNSQPPLLRNIITQPKALFRQETEPLDPLDFSNIFANDLKLPSIGEIRDKLADVFNINRDTSDPFGTQMRAAASTPIRDSLYRMANPESRANLDIIRIQPIKESLNNLHFSKPGLNLNSFKTNLPSLQKLSFKPIQLQSSKRNNNNVVGAVLTFQDSHNNKKDGVKNENKKIMSNNNRVKDKERESFSQPKLRPVSTPTAVKLHNELKPFARNEIAFNKPTKPPIVPEKIDSIFRDISRTNVQQKLSNYPVQKGFLNRNSAYDSSANANNIAEKKYLNEGLKESNKQFLIPNILIPFQKTKSLPSNDNKNLNYGNPKNIFHSLFKNPIIYKQRTPLNNNVNVGAQPVKNSQTQKSSIVDFNIPLKKILNQNVAQSHPRKVKQSLPVPQSRNLDYVNQHQNKLKLIFPTSAIAPTQTKLTNKPINILKDSKSSIFANDKKAVLDKLKEQSNSPPITLKQKTSRNDIKPTNALNKISQNNDLRSYRVNDPTLSNEVKKQRKISPVTFTKTPITLFQNLLTSTGQNIATKSIPRFKYDKDLSSAADTQFPVQIVPSKIETTEATNILRSMKEDFVRNSNEQIILPKSKVTTESSFVNGLRMSMKNALDKINMKKHVDINKKGNKHETLLNTDNNADDFINIQRTEMNKKITMKPYSDMSSDFSNNVEKLQIIGNSSEKDTERKQRLSENTVNPVYSRLREPLKKKTLTAELPTSSAEVENATPTVRSFINFENSDIENIENSYDRTTTDVSSLPVENNDAIAKENFTNKLRFGNTVRPILAKLRESLKKPKITVGNPLGVSELNDVRDEKILGSEITIPNIISNGGNADSVPELRESEAQVVETIDAVPDKSMAKSSISPLLAKIRETFKPSSEKLTITENPNTDMLREASDIVPMSLCRSSADSLQENVAYKCRLVCTRE